MHVTTSSPSDLRDGLKRRCLTDLNDEPSRSQHIRRLAKIAAVLMLVAGIFGAGSAAEEFRENELGSQLSSLRLSGRGMFRRRLAMPITAYHSTMSRNAFFHGYKWEAYGSFRECANPFRKGANINNSARVEMLEQKHMTVPANCYRSGKGRDRGRRAAFTIALISLIAVALSSCSSQTRDTQTQATQQDAFVLPEIPDLVEGPCSAGYRYIEDEELGRYDIPGRTTREEYLQLPSDVQGINSFLTPVQSIPFCETTTVEVVLNTAREVCRMFDADPAPNLAKVHQLKQWAIDETRLGISYWVEGGPHGSQGAALDDAVSAYFRKISTHAGYLDGECIDLIDYL